MGGFHPPPLGLLGLSQFSPSVSAMSWLRKMAGFNLFSRRCGTSSFGMRFAAVGFRFRFGVVVACMVALFALYSDVLCSNSGLLGSSWFTPATFAVDGGWSSGADFSCGAIGDLDRVCEYCHLGSVVHIVSHSGLLRPRIRFSQQKLLIGSSSAGLFSRYFSVAVQNTSWVILSGAM